MQTIYTSSDTIRYCYILWKKVDQIIWDMRSPRESAWEWPLQILPTEYDRKIWETSIRKLVGDDGHLRNKLGKWKIKSHQIWKYMVNKDRSGMLRHENGVQKNGRPHK